MFDTFNQGRRQPALPTEKSQPIYLAQMSDPVRTRTTQTFGYLQYYRARVRDSKLAYIPDNFRGSDHYK